MRVLNYTKLDPNIPVDTTEYNEGYRWRANTTHPTQPTVIGLRHIIDAPGLTKKEARANLVKRCEEIKANK